MRLCALIVEPRGLYAAVLGLAVIWLLAMLAAPQLLCGGHAWAALLLYRGFALVCQQRGERSFYWCGNPLAVCARCTGIYAGVLLGLLFCWRRKRPCWLRVVGRPPAGRFWLARVRQAGTLALPGLALALLGCEWAAEAAGLIRPNARLRMATGLLAGAVVTFYIWPVLLAALTGARQVKAGPIEETD